MDRWTEVAIAAIGLAAGLVNTVIMLKIGNAISGLRTEIANQRRQDAEELRVWVERRFQRRQQAPAS